MSKGIYLAAGRAYHQGHDITYQDISIPRDLAGNMLDIDLSPYDYIIATPPCNFWSRARGQRLSQYSIDTKHLLPDIIHKLITIGKPFIVENVRNDKRMTEEGVIPRNDCKIYYHNRHIYFTNSTLNMENIPERQDFKYGGHVIKYNDMYDSYHQGGYNVYNVIEYFINKVSYD